MQYVLKFGIVGIVLFITLSSVVGMASIFKTIAIPIGFLMLCIEAAKYGAIVYAYKEWSYLTPQFKIILMAFLTVLSLLTSIGIFGYLGDSFQNSHSRVQKIEIDISSLTAEKTRLEARAAAINRQIEELPKDYVVGRLKLMQAFAAEQQEISENLRLVNTKLNSAKNKSIDSVGDLGPVVYLAQQFSTTVENAVGKIMIFLTLSLDPFALFLTILLNRPKRLQTVAKQSIISDRQEPFSQPTNEWNFR